jgi:hypothetical protein
MVGVAGRSKGCDNCRRRHMKCGEFLHGEVEEHSLTGKDLGRPACGQCLKSRLVCGGPRDLAFVVYGGQQGAVVRKQKGGNAGVSTPAAKHTDAVVDTPSFNFVFNLPLLCDDVCTAFTRCNLLPENGHIVVPESVDCTITAQCFLALSYTYFGVKHREQGITQDGLRKYGKALSLLNGCITKSSAAQSFDVLESIMIMAMIEVSISSIFKIITDGE